MHFLFVDRILELTPGKHIKGIKHVTSNDYYLTEDEPGNLSFMPSLIGETLGQLAAWNVMLDNGFTKRPVAGIASSAKILRRARPGQTLLLESFIDRLDSQMVEYHSQATVDGELAFSLEGALGPLLPMEDFINQDLIQQQFAAIYKPGVWTPSNDANLENLPTHEKKGLVLAFDNIIECEPGRRMVAEKTISRTAPWIPDHFPLKPVLPMTVFMEYKINLALDFLAQSRFSVPYKLRELRKIKMTEFVEPGDVVTCIIQVKSRTDDALILLFRSERDGKRVCTLEMLFETES